ncbi:MAG: hypothetical protein ACLQOO_02585, partial [Terriglobia bacterium]
MAVETEAVPNPDAERGAQPQGDGVRDSGFEVRREEGDSGFGFRDSQSQGPSSSASPESRVPGPGSSTSPETQIPNPAQKPKRKYTMSPRAIESRRINIKKALAVPKEVLYRSTPKRKESC